MKQEQPLSLLHQAWLNDKGNTLKLAFVNTRSLQRHADDIGNSIYLNVCDVAVYAEEHLQGDKVPTQFSLKCPHLGYQTFSVVAVKRWLTNSLLFYSTGDQ